MLCDWHRGRMAAVALTGDRAGDPFRGCQRVTGMARSNFVKVHWRLAACSLSAAPAYGRVATPDRA